MTWNWPAVVALYDHLFALTGSPVVILNRAVARAEVDGPRAAIAGAVGAAADAVGKAIVLCIAARVIQTRQFDRLHGVSPPARPQGGWFFRCEPAAV